MWGGASSDGAGQLTPEWLTHAPANGEAQTSSVTSYDEKIIGEGVGFQERARAPDAPLRQARAGSAVIAYRQVLRPPCRRTARGDVLPTLRTRNGFYKHIAPEGSCGRRAATSMRSIPTTATSSCAEDLSPATCGDRVDGCSVEHVPRDTRWRSSTPRGGTAPGWTRSIGFRVDAEWMIDALEQNYEPCWPASSTLSAAADADAARRGGALW